MSSAGVPNIYMGTSEFAAEVLETLASSPHRPALVITPPDRRSGRGRKESPPPAAVRARELGLEVHQTSSVNEPDSIAAIRSAGVDVACVCAFGQLIKEPLLSEFPMLNVHPSLLPRWRGAAPVERAIMAGDERTGVCVMRLTAGLDSGPVALREEVAIDAAESYGELAPRLATVGGRLLVEALDLHATGGLEFTEQPESGVTYAEKISKEDRQLDPARDAAELERIVRALTPHVGASFELDGGDRLGVRVAHAVESDLAAGEVATGPEGLIVGCRNGALAIAELQPPGKRAMAAADWLRGHEPPDRIPGA